MATKQAGSQFIVHLEGIKLPAEAEAQIAKEVRATALRELGRLDLKGDVVVRIPLKEWLGLWLERTNQIVPPNPIGPIR